MSRTYDAVLFDLDGTIMDSAPIICRAQAQTLAAFGHPHSEQSLRAYVGPPLWQTFGELTREPDAVVDEMVRAYRLRYAELMSATPIFEPMAGLLRRLHDAGTPLALATSKHRTAARALLRLHGLERLFTVVQGAGEDAASGTKAAVVGRALVDLRRCGVPARHAVLVGDRSHDVEGAAAHGLPTIMVAWGYGSDAERVGVPVAADVDQLERLLTGP